MFIEEDPYNPTTIRGWIRSWALGKAIKAELADQASIDRDYAQMVAASDARDAQFWAQMKADGVPVADPEPGSFADRYAAAAAAAQADQWAANHTPTSEASAGEPEAGPEPEAEMS